MRQEPAGLAAGDLARALSVPQNTLSAHLNVLAHSELVVARRKGRSVVCRANISRARTLADFLVEDCCAGADCAAASPGLCVETAK